MRRIGLNKCPYCGKAEELYSSPPQTRRDEWCLFFQYITRKGTEQEAGSVFSFLALERIRAAFRLCGASGDDLKRTDIELQSGSLVQLYGAAKSMTEDLDKIINGPR